MKKIKRYCKLYFVYVGQFVKTIAQSKLDFFMGLIGFLLVQITGLSFLYLVFQDISTIQGWTYEQVVFLYGFSQIPRGIDHFFTDNLWNLAWNQVVNGEFDRYILRPVNILFQVISEKIQPDAIGEILVGIVLMYYSVKKGVFTLNIISVLIIIVSILFGSVIYMSIKLLFASLAFWIKISGTILYTAYETSNFSKYPISMYPNAIKLVITFIIPFACVSYFPVCCITGKGGFISTVGIEIMVAIVFFIIAYKVFILGIDKYESTGN